MEIGIAAMRELEDILEVLNKTTKKLLDQKVEQWNTPGRLHRLKGTYKKERFHKYRKA